LNVNSTKKLAQKYATVKMDPPLSHEVEVGEEVVEEGAEEEEVIEEVSAEAMVHLEKMVEIVKEVVKNPSFLEENSKRIPIKEETGEVAEDFVAEVDLEEVVVVIEVGAKDVVDSEDSEVEEVSEDKLFNV